MLWDKKYIYKQVTENVNVNQKISNFLFPLLCILETLTLEEEFTREGTVVSVSKRIFYKALSI